MTISKRSTAKGGLAAVALMAAALAVGPVAAQDSQGGTTSMKGMEMAPAAKAGSETPADRDFAKASATMMKNMDVKPSGNPDKDFADMMLPHHQGAIDMAKVELQYGKDPMLRKLAADIVKAQETEITEMRAWLGKNAR